MFKESSQEKDIIIINICVPKIGTPQYIRRMLIAIKEEIDGKTIIVGDFNNPTFTNGQIIPTENL